MPAPASAASVYRFGPFELNARTRELRKHGVRIKLQDQPLQLLVLLLERRGEVVNRQQIQNALWPPGVHVDYDNAINSAMRKLREALGDTSERPRYIETVARRGYQFIGNIDAPQHRANEEILASPPRTREESDSGKLTGIAVTVTLHREKSRRKWALAGVGVLLIMGTALGLWFFRPKSHAAQKTFPLTSYPGRQITPAFSPDGKQVAFAWDGEKGDNFDIYVKLVDAGTPLRLTNNAATEYSPAWSPDGRYIAFCRDRGERSEVWMIPALGGPERKLGESAGMYSGPEFSVFDRVRPTALSWSPDGKFLALSYRSSSGAPLGIYIMSAETGEKRRLTSPPKEYGGDLGPRFSPNGETLAFVRAPSHLSRAIYLLSMSGSGAARGEPRRLIPDQQWIGGFDWTPDGRNIVFSAGQFGSTNLWTIAASGGTPERLVGGENSTELSISRTGSRLVYVRSSLDYNIWRISGPNALDKDSVPTRFIASTQPDLSPQFSPDGEKIVFASARSGTYAIWVCDRDGLNPVELASDGTTVGSPRWSPDSHWIAFDSPKTGNEDIYVISAEGGPVRRLTAGPSNNIRPSWSKDGRWIYFGSNRNGDWQIWKAPAQGGTALQVTKKGAAEAFESFDGKFVYYAKGPGIWEVPVGGGEETQVLDQGSQNLWALTKQGIYFGVINSSVAPLLKFYRFATSQVEIFREFSKDTRLDSLSTAFSVSPDGQWILYTQLDQASSDLMLMENYR